MAVFWAMFFAGFQPFAVVTDADAAFGGFGGAIEEGVFARLFIVRDDVRFAAGLFHLVEGPELCGIGCQSGCYFVPSNAFVAVRVFLEAGF